MSKVNQKLKLSKAVKDARIKRELKKIIDNNFKFYETPTIKNSTISR